MFIPMMRSVRFVTAFLTGRDGMIQCVLALEIGYVGTTLHGTTAAKLLRQQAFARHSKSQACCPRARSTQTSNDDDQLMCFFRAGVVGNQLRWILL